jgi:hypothetical protein
MTKTSYPQPPSRTHFQQIPLKVVKKIADAEAAKPKKAGPRNLIVEPTSGKTEPYSGQVRMSLMAAEPSSAKWWR